MKRSIIHSLTAALVLYIMILTSSCGGPQPGNGNGNGNINSNTGNTNVGNSNSGNTNTGDIALSGLKCDDSLSIDDRKANVEAYLTKELDGDKDYKGNWHDQIHEEPQPPYPRKIIFTVVPKTKQGIGVPYLDIEVSGVGLLRANHNANDHNHPFKKLAEILDKVIAHGCVENVIFKGPMTKDFGDIGAFDVTACEWPLVPCNGECVETCNGHRKASDVDPTADRSAEKPVTEPKPAANTTKEKPNKSPQ